MIPARKQAGFTLIELMVTTAVVALLVSVALPVYGNYVKRAKFTEVIVLTSSAKSAVSLCIQETGTPKDCSGDGAEDSYAGIPPDITSPKGLVHSLSTVDGKITAQGDALELEGATFIIEANMVNGEVEWLTSGTCIDKNYCKKQRN